MLAVQVAAVDEPKLHLWDTGVIRITRHPQALGQLLWCLSHTLWIGNSFMVVTSLALVAHHAFGIWHGDFRLRRKWGEVRIVSIFEDSAMRVSLHCLRGGCVQVQLCIIASMVAT